MAKNRLTYQLNDILGGKIMGNPTLIDAKTRENFVEFLSLMYPGQDVQVRFRTRQNRDLSGYWCWSMTEIVHEHTPRRKVRDLYKTKEDIQDYHGRILRRTWRWKDVMKKLETLRDRGRTV